MANGDRARKFGLTLAKARQRADLSQAALGAAIGSTQSTISAWERGESEPPPDFVFKIETVLEMVPGELSLLLGYTPVPNHGMPTDTENAIKKDPKLSAFKRRLLLRIYGDLITDTDS